MLDTQIPTELQQIVGTEKPDFIVKAQKSSNYKTAPSTIYFSLFFLLVPVVVGYTFFAQFFLSLLNLITTRSFSVEFKLFDFVANFAVGLVVVFFLLIGLSVLYSGISALFKTGPYFVGTPTKLISYSKGEISYYGWDTFFLDIKVLGNTQKGDLKIGKKSFYSSSPNNSQNTQVIYQQNTSSSNSPEIESYFNDYLSMNQIPNPYEIEVLIRKRIQEYSQKTKIADQSQLSQNVSNLDQKPQLGF